ncbi:hypothetical protein Pmani_040214 [Petrolisthes manimaculis]|uniref:Uncharacterized protein n=1 Tax=Petrolisthes manimaculis TaxID=1843537 RepID=A0AAE1NCL8_9EUCA|nr:hypothetical protein Pmani_040214 [Petrolisthes manimaculis]
MPVDFGRLEALIKMQKKLKAFIFIVEKTTRVLDDAKPLLEVLGMTDPFWLPCRSLPPQLKRILEKKHADSEINLGDEVTTAGSQSKPTTSKTTKKNRVTFADDKLICVRHFSPEPFELESPVLLSSSQEPQPQQPSPQQQQPSSAAVVPGPSILKRSMRRDHHQGQGSSVPGSSSIPSSSSSHMFTRPNKRYHQTSFQMPSEDSGWIQLPTSAHSREKRQKCADETVMKE